MCFCWATSRRWLRRCPDKAASVLGLASLEILPPRSAGGSHLRSSEQTRLGGFRACRRRRSERQSIEDGIRAYEPEPTGKPDLTVVGIPDFPGPVPRPPASVGFHESR